MKKIINITLWLLLVAGIFVLVGFIDVEHKKITCKSVEVSFDYQEIDPLITQNEINKKLYKNRDSLVGKKLSEINLADLENSLNKIPQVARADVYTSITGKLTIKIKQRNPLFRVINSAGQNYYIDSEGFAFQANFGHSTRVLVANGFISQKYSDTLKVDPADVKSLLAKLFTISSYINDDKFLKAQIEQIYVTKDKEFELVPKVGRQLIIFGDVDNMENKFKKLLVLYEQGLNKTGWDKYNTINLKFENQVVCSKN